MPPRHRIIREILDNKGRPLVSSWVAKKLTKVDQAKIENRFNRIEIDQIENPSWVVYYKSLRMWEIKVDSGGKAIRFLCDKDEDDIILVIGVVKRGQIEENDEIRAVGRREEYRKGKLSVRDYPLPQRPPDYVEESSK